MARVLVVDDSPSVRALLASRLKEKNHEVQEAVDAQGAMEIALASPPEVVVTDLVMRGLSGVQLCRLLRSDPATAHVPVVLLTASGDKRSRFWARSAGAAAYVSKDHLDDLVALLPNLISGTQAPTGVVKSRARPALYERISSILDGALFDSVFAGEVRALASSGELARMFAGLASLVSDVLTYRWIAVAPEREYAPVFVHCHPSESGLVESCVREALDVPADREIAFVTDERAVASKVVAPEIATVLFAGQPVGRVALAPTGRGLSREDKRLVLLIAGELGGSLQMTALYEDARRLATTDALTGLLNRRAFLDAMDRERARSDRHTFPMSLLLLDVDHFKSVNDRHGHAAGDAVLRGIARVLRSVARRSDFVARWGGEEFVVGLPQTGEAGARVAAERVRRAIAAATYPIPEGGPLEVTASVGVASEEAPWLHDALVLAADQAMYAAKARGRNRVESAQMREEGSTRPVEAAPQTGSQ